MIYNPEVKEAPQGSERAPQGLERAPRGRGGLPRCWRGPPRGHRPNALFLSWAYSSLQLYSKHSCKNIRIIIKEYIFYSKIMTPTRENLPKY